MASPKLIQKRGNVYHSPVAEPKPNRPVPSNIDPVTGEIIGPIMKHNSESNIGTWWTVFTEMASECADWQKPTYGQDTRKRRR